MNQYISPRSKLFAHPDKLAAIKAGQRPAPVNVEIDLSNRCPLKCSGCHFSYTHTRGPWAGKADKPEGAILGGDLMDETLAYSILSDLAISGVKSITWTGGGEPSIHPQFDKIIEYAASRGLEQGIYTYGGLIRGDRAAFMRKHFAWIYFSLDACTRETYRNYKGVDQFERVTDNIRRIVEMDGNATIGVGFLLHAGNWQDVHSMVALGRELGVAYVQFRPLILFEQATPQRLIDETQWIDRAVGRLNAYRDDPFVQCDIDRFRMYQHWQGHSYQTCYWSALQTVITPNGRVWRCTNKREHPDALLGDLSAETFAQLWERAGGPCQVNSGCRVMCRGAIANLALDAIMTEPVHKNFI